MSPPYPAYYAARRYALQGSQGVARRRTIAFGVATITAIVAARGFRPIANDIGRVFLLIAAGGIGVPKAYLDNWPAQGSRWGTVLWMLTARTAAAIVFVALYVVGTAIAGGLPFLTSVGVFCVTFIGDQYQFSFLSRR